MTQRRVHNPNGVDTGGTITRRILYANYDGIVRAVRAIGYECSDCGMWLGMEPTASGRCDDCRCIRETGEQCRYPDMEQSTIGG